MGVPSRTSAPTPALDQTFDIQIILGKVRPFLRRLTEAHPQVLIIAHRVLHVAARICRGARQIRLRIDATWRWAAAIATAWQHLRTAFD